MIKVSVSNDEVKEMLFEKIYNSYFWGKHDFDVESLFIISPTNKKRFCYLDFSVSKVRENVFRINEHVLDNEVFAPNRDCLEDCKTEGIDLVAEFDFSREESIVAFVNALIDGFSGYSPIIDEYREIKENLVDRTLCRSHHHFSRTTLVYLPFREKEEWELR